MTNITLNSLLIKRHSKSMFDYHKIKLYNKNITQFEINNNDINKNDNLISQENIIKQLGGNNLLPVQKFYDSINYIIE